MWDNIKGHQQNKEFLKSLLQGGRSTPSLLFYGPEGVGKRLLAKAFAKSFLCLGNPLEPDNCRSCHAMDAGTHPDLVQVAQLAPGKELLIEQIKDMARQAAYAPTMSTHKVCIIDGADFMKAPAANSLLKLLEEPPEYWLFILIATDINKLLPTILSRVIQRRFTGLEDRDVAAILAEHQVEHPEELARLAAGSPGKALAYQQADALMWRERALNVLENAGNPAIMDFIGNLEWLDKVGNQDGLIFLEMFSLLLRDGLFLKDGTKCQFFNIDLEPRLEQCFKLWTTGQIEKTILWTGESYRGIRARCASKSVIEALIVKISLMGKEQDRD
jgi:DNA polymerase-3 subunit delta'